ncbi:MAG: ribosome maturation factor RimP [Erysipelotrichaceae bacterium]|nr:ribosome maturation factor RimP [Erysipelotrichaceae bacterium]
MELKTLENLISPILNEANVSLVELKWLMDQKTRILQVAIMHPDGSMDLETCSVVSQKISDLLDTTEMVDTDYYLEVCSPGAERQLKGTADIQLAIGGNVHLTLIHPLEKSLEHEGSLLDYDGKLGHLEIVHKTRKKILEFSSDNILKIRLAVKL